MQNLPTPSRTPGIVTLLSRPLLCIIGLLLAFCLPACEAFNLDVDKPAVYSGPTGSYFGYAVDFYLADSASASVVIGAPKANTRQLNVKEGGSVFYCPWSLSQSDCHIIEFDTEGDRVVLLNDTEHQADFKSHQWFGATVRSHGDTILACAPLYSWRTEKDIPHSDATGTCYLSVHNFTKFVEYAPCRTGNCPGQGYCQGGFSADFTTDGKVVLGGPGSYYWQGEVITAAKEEIIKAYYPGYFMQSVKGQIQTKQVRLDHDDSYQGYSVAAGEFSGDEMGSYFGYAVATTDINSDGMTDLLVGAPMFMVRGSDGRLEEMGRVYVYQQRGPLTLELHVPHLTGTQAFGRFGSTIAPLGDLNQDGFNDVAISCPFGGEDQQGLVYIYNGYSEGLRDKPSQVITGQWAAGTIPASFGFALRGAKDLDMNGYPDLIVGAFGVNKAVLYRYVALSRPIVNTSASLTVYPTMINPEEKNCMVTSGNTTAACCAADVMGESYIDNFQVEVQLDSHKHKQKSAVKRALFLDSQQPLLQRNVRVRHGERVCNHTKIYLRDEKDFRDKLSAIYVALNFSLNPNAAADSRGLQPILNYQTLNVIEQKAQILLDCGEDNICVPDLKLSVHGDRKEVYLGDDNSLTLTFNAKNEGEGGAYEAELYVVLPPEADYSGIARNNEVSRNLTCSYETENQTRYLSCDLGNPMKSGANVRTPLSFFSSMTNGFQRCRTWQVYLIVAQLTPCHGFFVSRPDKIFFPPANWKVTKNYGVEQDVGPAVEHIYELVNNGPSRISHTLLELRCPLSLQGHTLLYPLEFYTEGSINCTADKNMNHLQLKVSDHTSTEPPILALKAHEHHVERRDVHRYQLAHLTNLSCSNAECWTVQCTVGLLEKGTTAILKVRSRIWAETFTERTYKQYVLECLARYSVKKMPYAIPPKHAPSGHKKVVTPVVWNKPDIENSVPLWIIILAILAGLLLLALLIYVLYKVSAAVKQRIAKIPITVIVKIMNFSVELLGLCYFLIPVFSDVFVHFCSLASSSDLCLTALPWRKHS
uniref:Integrin, alpha 5 (fibronectin receptor, alpha polypeptide) n=1 Tax=Mastacembelus armatus TaxID=205130 RepID=A0A7N8WW96_9TELE